MIDFIITIKQRRGNSTPLLNRRKSLIHTGGLRFSPRGLRFSPGGLRFSPEGLRFSPQGLRS